MRLPPSAQCLVLLWWLAVADAAVGMPTPNFYSSSFATMARNATSHARQRAEYRLRQFRDKCHAHACHHMNHKNYTTPYGGCSSSVSSSSDGNSHHGSLQHPYKSERPTSTSTITHQGGQDPNDTVLLNEYISKLEQRLARMEQQQVDMNTTLSVKQPPMLVEGLRLFAVTTLPMVTYSLLLGLGLVVLMHTLTWLLDVWTPVADLVVMKAQWLVLVVAKGVVDLLGGPSTPTTEPNHFEAPPSFAKPQMPPPQEP